MKKIIVLFLILCISASLFACSGNSEGTDTVTDKETETAAGESTTNGTETEAGTAGTETEENTVTETVGFTETETETEPAPEGPAVYAIYDPMKTAEDHTGKLTLYDTLKFKAEQSYTDRAYGVNAHVSLVNEGDYSIDEQGVDLELRSAAVTVKYAFDSEAKKEEFLKNVKDQYLYGVIDGEKYETLKNAANGEVKKVTDDVIKAIVDNGTAYYLIPGAAQSDNEYYIVENDYTLILNGDGSCSMRRETLEDDGDKGFGAYIVSDVYEGTYTRLGEKAACIITQSTVKHTFTDDDSLRAYKNFYEQQYAQGYLGKVFYDYYMALVSEGGCLDDDMSDHYLILLEDHTHTARILESPDSEM